MAEWIEGGLLLAAVLYVVGTASPGIRQMSLDILSLIVLLAVYSVLMAF